MGFTYLLLRKDTSLMCRHGANSQPDRCSQCLGAVVKRVVLVGRDVLVDGVRERASEPEAWSPQTQRARQRGGQG